MTEYDAPQELRCECSRRPLLGKVGIHEGSPFLWVRHVKASKTIVDMKVFGGPVQIECRECRRVWTISLRHPVTLTQPRLD